MSEMATQLVANIFKALSHPTRLQIVKLLMEKPLCVCEIVPQLESEQSNTSQHLSVLKSMGIVESKREGLMMIYKIKSPEVFKMIAIAEEVILRQIEETKSSMTSKKIKKTRSINISDQEIS